MAVALRSPSANTRNKIDLGIDFCMESPRGVLSVERQYILRIDRVNYAGLPRPESGVLPRVAGEKRRRRQIIRL